ncbi:MAG: CDP-alcohol phosphatidyltransferase family protein, partial [Candidatus Diapherotrites archaeon]|nr:CDP-alcohol phosphatidyltransferase family protein [Candidatus Diapherotrites archaeon]
MLSSLRPAIKPFAKLLAKPFILLKVSPNLISVLGLVFAVIGAFFVIHERWLLAFVFFLLAPVMDLIDGEVARALNKRSNWGNY